MTTRQPSNRLGLGQSILAYADLNVSLTLQTSKWDASVNVFMTDSPARRFPDGLARRMQCQP